MMSNINQQALTRAASVYAGRFKETPGKMLGVATDMLKAGQLYGLGVLVYMADFMVPFWTAWEGFNRLEKEKLSSTSPIQSAAD